MMAQLQKDNDRLDLAPKKFNMWIFIFTSFMFFAALTSGFIVYIGGREHALGLKLPDVFALSTVIIMASSITMFLASQAAKHSQFSRQKLLLLVTIALGILFFFLQLYGWYTLAYKMQLWFVNPNAAISFIYIFTGMHLLHIFAGLVLLINSLRGVYKNIAQARNLFKMEMSSIFWHFVDIIWIYLYVFLLLNQH